MNKAELIGAVAAKAALSQKETGKVVNAIIKTVENAVGKDEKVTLMGFGTFTTLKKKSRKGINPRTKESMEIPAHKVVKFKPGLAFAEAVK
jgi:DNA-binding protein HU-beta